MWPASFLNVIAHLPIPSFNSLASTSSAIPLASPTSPNHRKYISHSCNSSGSAPLGIKSWLLNRFFHLVSFCSFPSSIA
ncbi:MAG: hypothetical protein Q8P67_13220 [archaeon]|nr:hypothetical protein [archaeon]